MKLGLFVLFVGLLVITTAVSVKTDEAEVRADPNAIKEVNYMDIKDHVWKQKLTPLQYHILREKGTERPNTGIYNRHFRDGVYTCAACEI